MEHVSRLPKVNLKFEAALLKAAAEGRALRTLWERHYEHRMTYDEFHMRRDLTLEVREGRMIPARARECLETYKQRTAENEQALGLTQPGAP